MCPETASLMRDESITMEDHPMQVASPKASAGIKFAERINGRVVAALVLWYFWSGCTLFLNKYLIDQTSGDAVLLSEFSYCYI